jgi:hypothetical protein
VATPIGTNTINSISRRFLMPSLFDNVYNSNAMFFRLNALNKKIVQGGIQFEVPLIFQRWSNGGFYTGYDLLDVTPADTVKNGAWDWRQAEVAISVSGLDLIRADHPDAVVNLLSFQFENAQMEIAEILGAGVWSTDTNPGHKSIDGIPYAVDNTGTVTYGGLLRSANTFWQSTLDTTSGSASTATLTLLNLQTMFGTLTVGGRHPTIIISTQAGYNKYWNLNTPSQSFPVQPAGHDEQLAQSGFTNLLFNGVPWLVDSHVPANNIFMLNEDYWYLLVNPRADLELKEFREPVNQDAMTAFILWAGNLLCTNVARQGKFTNVQF